MQLFLENSIEIIGLLMQKITYLMICVLYNCMTLSIFLIHWINSDSQIMTNNDSKILQNYLSINKFQLQINQFYTVNVRLDL